MHPASAYRAKSGLQPFGDRKHLDTFGNGGTFNNEVGIFQVDQFCDIINHINSPFNTTKNELQKNGN